MKILIKNGIIIDDFEKLSAHVYIATQTLDFRIHHRGQASKVGFIPAPTTLVHLYA